MTIRSAAFSLCITLVACNQSTPAPEKEAPPAALAPQSSASAAMVPVTTRPAAPKVVPTLTAVPFEPEGTHPELVAGIEGGIAVAEGLRVGRIEGGERIEWVGKIPADDNQGFGGSFIASVHGRFPDSVDVLYYSNQGRAPQPTYTAVTGKGQYFRVGEGGMPGDITDVATVGESTLVAALMYTGYIFMTVRGPKLSYKLTSFGEAGCKPEEEFRNRGHTGDVPALAPRAFAATETGTVMTVGTLCDKRGPTAEVWDKPGEKSRLVDLGEWLKAMDYSPDLLRSRGDELFLYPGQKDPILRYRNGKFEPLPRLDKPITFAFVSQNRVLHALAGQTIHRFDEGTWVPVAHLAWPMKIRALVLDKDTLWGSTWRNVFKFRETKSLALTDDCATPFVYLYDVSPDNAPDFTFPSTRKALASFEGASDLGLVEFREGTRRLGLTVKSKQQAEAVLAHIKATMKNEEPKLLCYAPTSPRSIPLTSKGK